MGRYLERAGHTVHTTGTGAEALSPNLRHRLGDTGGVIVDTVLGVGYRLGWSRDR